MKRLWLCAAAWLLAILALPAVVFAQYTSTNYSSNEVFIGSGGDTGQSSTNYQAQASIGGLGVDTPTSTSFHAYSGFLTPNTPFLSLNFTTSLVSLGALNTASAATGQAGFQVTAYTDSGYSIEALNPPPTSVSGASHTLANMSSTAASAPGTEQFGMNLVANTAPATCGSNPAPQPDSSFAAGAAATGYATVNQYKYNSGDVVAQTSGNGWGQTNFTICYIANISIATPAGSYSMNQDLVAIATY